MSTVYLGSLSLEDAVPGAAVAASAGIAGINGALPDLLARIAALQAWTPSPVSFSVQLTLANQIVSSIQQAITLGLPVPDISAQISAIAALLGSLLAALSSINAQLTVITDFQDLLAAAGVHGFAFAGTVSSLGSELDAAVAGGGISGAGNALVLLTTIGGTWTTMSQVFKTTP